MNKDEVLKKLEKHKEESEDYSNYALMNEGYRAAMMDAIDLVKNLTIPVVVFSEERAELCQCKGFRGYMTTPEGRLCTKCNKLIWKRHN